MIYWSGDRQLKGAFALALLLHGMALAAAAHLPAPGLAASSLEELQVFDSTVAFTATPVALVELPASSGDPPQARNIEMVRPVASADRPERAAPTTRLRAREQRPSRTRAISRPSRVHVGAARQARGGPERTGAPGGGGGAPVDLGPPSSGGTLDVPSGSGEGGTAPGSIPGQGSGEGPGTGAGSGGGSGTGVGGGEGDQVGSGSGGAGEGPEPGFVSRLADRAEPEVIQRGRLIYPEAAIVDGAEGTCVLKVLVGEKGEVIAVEVTRSSGDRRLDKAALEFVKRWRYRPAIQDGKPRRVYTRATVQFALN